MKQEIAEIRSELGKEDNVITASVDSLLNKIQKEHDTFKVDLTEAGEKIDKQDLAYNKIFKETKKRQATIATLERERDEAVEAKDNILKDTQHEDYGKLKKYHDDNEKRITDKNKVTVQRFIESHKTIVEHEDYEKAKPGFALPEEKDGVLDWESVSIDAMVLNMHKLEEYQGLGLFGGKTDRINVNTESVKGSVGKYKTRAELSDAFTAGDITQKEYEEEYKNFK